MICPAAFERYKMQLKQSKGLHHSEIQINTKCLILQNHLLRKPRYLFRFIFGSLDYHSIFRLLAVRSAISNVSPTIDVGASSGSMTIELLSGFKVDVDALVYEQGDIEKLQATVRDFRITHFGICKEDAQVLEKVKDNYASQLLLLDVLEHVVDDNAALKSCSRVLVTGGKLIISVPTPYYPLFFGAEFDAKIGHRRHYLMCSLKPMLFKNGFEISDYFYYTSEIPSSYCHLLYRRPKLKRVLNPIDAVLRVVFRPIFEIVGLQKERPSKILHFHSSLLVVCTKK